MEISVQVDTESVEAVSEVFRRYVYGGVSIEQEIDPSAEGDGYAVRVESPATIKGYLPLDKDASTKVRRVEEGLWHLSLVRPIQSLSTRMVSEDDWKDAWKQFYDTHRIGKRVVVKPSWRDYDPRPDDVVISIDPGMAFGTGLHPTTQMCLVQLEEHVKPGQSVLDLGTGSGILAIAAAHLGAREVIALDIDNVAVSAARKNVELNSLQEVVRVELGSLDVLSDESCERSRIRSGEFEVVVANIIANVIVELSHALAAAVKPSGIVIAGGIIDEKCDLVVDSLKAAGLRIMSEVRCGDWVTLVAQKIHD